MLGELKKTDKLLHDEWTKKNLLNGEWSKITDKLLNDGGTKITDKLLNGRWTKITDKLLNDGWTKNKNNWQTAKWWLN
jgi:hypothetical protein